MLNKKNISKKTLKNTIKFIKIKTYEILIFLNEIVSPKVYNSTLKKLTIRNYDEERF